VKDLDMVIIIKYSIYPLLAFIFPFSADHPTALATSWTNDATPDTARIRIGSQAEGVKK
jgi:hypothetical protein